MKIAHLLVGALLSLCVAQHAAYSQQAAASPELSALVKNLAGKSDVADPAAAQLVQMGPQAAPALPELINAIGSRWGDRTLLRYCKVFVAIGDPAIDALAAAMKDQAIRQRQNIGYALAQFKSAKAVPAFVEALKDKNSGVRAMAVYGLGELTEKTETQAAIPNLIALLNDNDTYAMPTTANDGDRVSELVVATLVKFGAPAVELLQKAANDQTSPMQRAARAALSKMRDPGAFDRQMQELKQEDPDRRAEAAMALAEMKDPRAFEPLAALIKDTDPMFRMIGCMALAKTEDARAKDLIFPLIKDESPMVQGMAVSALGELKDTRVLEPAIAMVTNASKYSGTSMMGEQMMSMNGAAAALGNLGDPRGVAPLVALLKAPWGKQSPASESLAKIGKPAVEPLIELLNGTDDYGSNYAVITALTKIGDRRATPALVAKVQARKCVNDACAALVKLDDPTAIEGLIAAFEQQKMGDYTIEGTLYSLTKRKRDGSKLTWRQWWEENKASFDKPEAAAK